MYLTNPYAGNPLFAGFRFQYPPARIPLYTLKPFGTSRPTEKTTARTMKVTDTESITDQNTETESITDSTTEGLNGEDEEFRQ